MYTLTSTKCQCGCGLDITKKMKATRKSIIRDVEKQCTLKYESTSLARCRKRNSEVGGSDNSAHMRGEADDVFLWSTHYLYILLKTLFDHGIKRIFINFDKHILHWDIGNARKGYAICVVGKD